MLPSANATLHPCEWLLPMLVSLNVPDVVYVWIRMALATFLEQPLSLFQLNPRGQERYVRASRPVHDASNTISVLLVPSMMSGSWTAAGPGVGLRAVTTNGMNGRTPSAARPPW